MSDKKSAVLCKFYAQGACAKGTACPFSHDRAASRPDNICRYYLQRACTYGDKCRYDHVRPTREKTSSSSSFSSSSFSGHQKQSAQTTKAGVGGGKKLRLVSSKTKHPSPVPANHGTAAPLSHIIKARGPASTKEGDSDATDALGERKKQKQSPRVRPGAKGSVEADRERPQSSRPAIVLAPQPRGNIAPSLPSQQAPAVESPALRQSYSSLASTGLSDRNRQHSDDAATSHGLNVNAAEFFPSSFSSSSSSSTAKHPSTETMATSLPMAPNAAWGDEFQQQFKLLRDQMMLFAKMQREQADANADADAQDPPPPPSSSLSSLPLAKDVSYSSMAKFTQDDEESLRFYPLCPVGMMSGSCPSPYCVFLHGLPCPVCKLLVLHPYRANEHEAHINACLQEQEADSKREELEKRSADVECCICMDVVKEKAVFSERRFGILPNCSHPFCLRCIRTWRTSKDHHGEMSKCCPICRTQSHFVVPSSVWVVDANEKEKLISTYRDSMKQIDCQNFNFGAGECPFGPSCFYRHITKDGKEDKKAVRILVAADGTTAPMKNVLISDFFVERERRSFEQEFGQDDAAFYFGE